MPKPTDETVRTIITEVVNGLRQEMHDEFAHVHQELADVRQEQRQEFAAVRQEMCNEFAHVRQEFADGLDQVLQTVQTFHDEDQEALTGLGVRLHDHNLRITKLERVGGLRA